MTQPGFQRSSRLFLALSLVFGLCACRGETEAPSSVEAAEVEAAAPKPATGPHLLPVRRVRGADPRPLSLEDRMRRFGASAVGVAVVEDGAVAEVWAWELDSSGSPLELGPEVLFPAGSLTSPVAAAVVGSGVVAWAAREQVDLNVPLSSWLRTPRLGSSPSPTIAQVLGHTSGLADGPQGGASAATLEDLVADGELQRVDAPGRSHRHSAAGVLLLRELLVRQTGRDLQQAMEDLVLGPWGLRSTWMEGLPAGNTSGVTEGAAATPIRTVGPAAGGGGDAARTMVWSTPSDLARWVAGLVVSARGVRDAAPLPWALARRSLEPGPGGWAWGVEIVEPGPRFQVVTEEDGVAVLAVGYVASESGAVVMVVGGSRGSWLGREVVLGLAERRGWPGLEVEELEPAPTESVARALVGDYRLDEGLLEIRFEEGSLVAHADPGVLAAEAVRQTIHPTSPLTYVFVDRPERLEFVRTRGAGVRGLLVDDRRALRVDETSDD